MSTQLVALQELLDGEDVDGFLLAYEQDARGLVRQVELTRITQRLLPPILLRALKRDTLPPVAIVRAWRLIRSGVLLVVDDAILAAINDRLQDAVAAVEGPQDRPLERLRLFSDSIAPAPARTRSQVLAGSSDRQDMRRVVVTNTFTFGVVALSDALNFKRNVCASPQEREFLKAVRQFFPNLQAYPNVPLRNFIDVDRMEDILPLRIRNYCWSAQVDVLLCTDDEGPVAGIELDSRLHDEDEARERDAQKDQVFKLAGLPLIRIRPTEPATVRAEDFYTLLVSESEQLDQVRPRRLRARRDHDFLVPAE